MDKAYKRLGKEAKKIEERIKIASASPVGGAIGFGGSLPIGLDNLVRYWRNKK